MGIAEKLANAKKTNWISEGLSESEVKTIVELAKECPECHTKHNRDTNARINILNKGLEVA